jgi:hypothetical protein
MALSPQTPGSPDFLSTAPVCRLLYSHIGGLSGNSPPSNPNATLKYPPSYGVPFGPSTTPTTPPLPIRSASSATWTRTPSGGEVVRVASSRVRARRVCVDYGDCFSHRSKARTVRLTMMRAGCMQDQGRSKLGEIDCPSTCKKQPRKQETLDVYYLIIADPHRFEAGDADPTQLDGFINQPAYSAQGHHRTVSPPSWTRNNQQRKH